jgi:hypothetical protein
MNILNCKKLIYLICGIMFISTPLVVAVELPSDPNNAALLYYQAFIALPEPNETIDYKLHTLYSGSEPDRQIRMYLGHCLPVIELAETASRIPRCIWGVWPERELRLISLRRELFKLITVLLVDAKTLTVDGHYRVALERCLTVRRISQHLSEDPELYIFSAAFDAKAFNTILYVLCVMPPDEDILTWFRGQLVVVQGPILSFTKGSQAYLKQIINHFQTSPIGNVRDMLVILTADELDKENIQSLTDEQIRLLTINAFQNLFNSALQIVDSELTYEQKRNEILRVINESIADHTDKVRICELLGNQLDDCFQSQVHHIAYINVVKAAVEVYLIVAKTGKLPEKLPDYLPKDPFTGQNFEYEITDEGFALRCQGKEFLRSRNNFLKFKVKR